jgi:hypothetical protein
MAVSSFFAPFDTAFDTTTEGQAFATLFFAHFDTAFDTACDNQIGVRERERISNVIFSHGDTAFDTANHPILGSGKGKCGKGGVEGHWLQ